MDNELCLFKNPFLTLIAPSIGQLADHIRVSILYTVHPLS
jgi:hypothetical protein